MIEQLNNYNWEEAFKYANSPSPAFPNLKIPVNGFKREDVVLISGIVEGENDEASWIIYGKLNDGRWFFLQAWCDYTGWG